MQQPLLAWFFYFLKLGATGFGGPVALAHLMQRDLVGERRWVTQQQYLDGLALSKLCPGPLAGQIAMYLGWLRAGAWGAALCGFALVFPALVMVLLIAALYVHFGSLPAVHAILYGVSAAAVAIFVTSGWRLVRASLAGDRELQLLCAANALLIVFWHSDPLLPLLLSGALMLWRRGGAARPPASAAGLAFFLTGAGAAASPETLGQIFLFFAKAGALVFGSGMAIVPALRAGVVEQFQWLTEQQFVDAVAVGMLTPGPLVIAGAFMAYLVAGPVGAAVAAFATFLPVYVFTLVLAPQYARIAGSRRVQAFVGGLTAAAMGAIIGAGVQLSLDAIRDVPAVLMALSAFAILWRWPRFPQALLILAAGVLGIFLV